MKSITIIDYGSGNLASAQKAFERASREQNIAAEVLITADPDKVSNADYVVLPGVGAFADCRAGLDNVSGMQDAMVHAVREKGRPFFGICVGHQLMATRGLEKVTTNGLGWIKGDVKELTPSDPSLKVPHMGWNTLSFSREHPVLENLDRSLHAYFVHSFHMMPEDSADVLASADYGGQVTAMVAKDNLIGAQFHPEKSQTFGLALIGNFLKWKP